MKISAEGLLASRLPTHAPSHPLWEMAVAVSFLVTAAGPRRIFTGFPDAADRVIINSCNGVRNAEKTSLPVLLFTVSMIIHGIHSPVRE